MSDMNRDMENRVGFTRYPEKEGHTEMDQQQTFNWLVERHRALLAVEEALYNRFGIESPSDDDPRFWVQAEPGPVECDSLAGAIVERAEILNREDMASRERIAELELAERQLLALDKARTNDWLFVDERRISVRYNAAITTCETLDSAADWLLDQEEASNGSR